MSISFQHFTQAAGSGPDAKVGEPRVLSLANGRLEAEGRIAPTPGWEARGVTSLPAIARAYGAGDGMVVCGTDQSTGTTETPCLQLANASSLAVIGSVSCAEYAGKKVLFNTVLGAIGTTNVVRALAIAALSDGNIAVLYSTAGSASAGSVADAGTLRVYDPATWTVLSTTQLTWQSSLHYGFVVQLLGDFACQSEYSSSVYVGYTRIWKYSTSTKAFSILTSYSPTPTSSGTWDGIAGGFCFGPNGIYFTAAKSANTGRWVTYVNTTTGAVTVTATSNSGQVADTSIYWNGSSITVSATKRIDNTTGPDDWSDAAFLIKTPLSTWSTVLVYGSTSIGGVDWGTSPGFVLWPFGPWWSANLTLYYEPATSSVWVKETRSGIVRAREIARCLPRAAAPSGGVRIQNQRQALTVIGQRVYVINEIQLTATRWACAVEMFDLIEDVASTSVSTAFSPVCPEKYADSVAVPSASPDLVIGTESVYVFPEWTPPAPTSTGTAGTAGTFQYCYCFKYQASDGSYYYSPVSSITTTAALYNMIVLGPPYRPGYERVTVELYRTLTTGTTFYLVAEVVVAATQTMTGTTADASISSNKILYTQGATGALSGRYETSGIPPCGVYYAGKSRHIAGNLQRDGATAVRFSDNLVSGEIVCWPVGSQWVVDLRETVVAVGELDGVPIVFTTDGVWSITGGGPDAAGEGSFDTPRRLYPSGALSSGSIVECPAGWFFQGQDHQLYLLKRGALSVEPAAANMRSFSGRADTAFLPRDSVVTSALYVPAESKVLFSVRSTNTRNRLIAYDLETDQLYDDDVTGSVSSGAYVGAALDTDYPLVLVGEKPCGTYLDEFVVRRTEGAASWWCGPIDDGTPLPRPLAFSTSSLSPWGPAGWGRVREVVFSTENLGSDDPDASVSVFASGALVTSDVSYSEDDRTVRAVPVVQKCSTAGVNVVDRTGPPLVWNGVFLDTTSTGRSRV